MGEVSNAFRARLVSKQKDIAKLLAQMQPYLEKLTRSYSQISNQASRPDDPLHGVYAGVQNITSVFAEYASRYKEFRAYTDAMATASEEYMPGYPPMSPLTDSYFTTWAFFDYSFGRQQETLGFVFRDSAAWFGLEEPVWKALEDMLQTRMGIYEVIGTDAVYVQLRELLTNREYRCFCPSGYSGRLGQLWYVRLCPPRDNRCDYHIVFTTPYVLMGATKEDWTAYLKKSIAGNANEATALSELFKTRRNRQSRSANESWNEFVFQAFSNFQSDAIFLHGIPDIPRSLPHAPSAR